VRRLTAALAALVTALGLTLVVTGAAEASITSPTNGSTVSGTIVLSDTGATDSSSLCITGSSAQTRVRVFNAANATVFDQTKSGSGVASFTWDTHTVPNGAYKLQTDVRNKSGTIFCSNSSSTFTSNFTITNVVDINYTTATSAPQNTTIGVSATVTDPSTGSPVSGLTISFALSGGTTVTAATNAAGVAATNLPIAGPPRTGSLTVSFAGTTSYAAKSVVKQFDVTKNASVTTLATPAAVVHGQPISFTATVAAGNGTGTPSGTVQFTVDGSNFGAPVALAGGSATTPATTTLSTGTHTVGALYSGDANFLAGAATTKSAVVNKAGTTTDLQANPTPTVSGQAVTFTATVAVVAPGAGTPTGGVQFNIDGQPFGTAVPLTGNTATLTVSNLPTGNHHVQATYNGDADFAASNSATITHGVNKADSDLALSTSDATAVSGEALTFTANVTAVAPGAGTPTGNVQFFVDGDPLGAPVALVGGQASSPTTHLNVGTHAITANYEGDANFGGANDSLSQDVGAASTSTTVASSPNPSVFGQPVTLHAEVTVDAPGSGNPTGTVKFTIDGSQEIFVPVSGGVAETSISTLSVGSHTIRAGYQSDDSNFLNSSSADISQVVNKAATKTVVSSSAPTSVFGQPVTFTATVSVLAPGAGAPSGTITFTDGAAELGTVAVDSGTGFTATLTTSALSVGQHAITATYSGDDSFLTSNDSTTQTVQKAQTSTVVTSSNNPAASGQATVFTAQVSPVAPGAGVPSGTVLFTVNGLPLGGARPLVAGIATSPSFSALTPGTYKVQAQYSGDGNFQKSTGLLDQGAGQNVSKGATSTGLTASPDPAAYNASVTFTATVSAVAPATGKPSGVVRFWEGGVLLGSSSLSPAGTNSATATFVDSTLPPGGHSIRAEYVGNFNFTGSDATTSVTVDRVPTVTGIESSANPITFGDSVTLTGVVSEALPAAGEPTGTVTFTEGTTVLGTGTISTVSGRQVASITVAGLHGGAHGIKATYSGDTTFAGSTSATYTENVSRQATNVAAGSPSYAHDANSIPTHAGFVRAKLTDGAGNPMPGRTIAFTNKPTAERPAYLLCTAVTGADGIAECDYTVINIDPSLSGSDLLLDVNGDYDATYSGDGDYQPATDRGHLF
jgi:hypothetical protein